MEGRTKVKVIVKIGGDVMAEVTVKTAEKSGGQQGGRAGFLEITPVQKVLGLSLSRAREAKGITTTEMGKRVGISQAQVSRLENGRQGFRSYLLPRFAEALGTSVAVVCEPVAKPVSEPVSV